MIGRQKRKSRTSEQGVALVIALLTLLLISAVLMGMIIASNSETNISTNFRDEQTAFFAARAGIEEIRDRLRPNANPSLSGNSFFTAVTTAQAGQPFGVLYVINPANGETVAPWNLGGTNYPDDEICKEIPCTTGSNPLPTWNGVPTPTWYVTPAPSSLNNSYAATPPLVWKWVRIMQKPNKSDTGSTRITSVNGAVNNYLVCFNGSNEHVAVAGATVCPDKPVYELTSLAVTPSGSRRMVQYEISQTSLPPIPGALVFDGPTPDFTTNPHSGVFGVIGNDVPTGPKGGAGCPAATNEPALGGYNPASATSLQGQVNRPANYTGSPAGIADVSSQLGPLSTVDGLTSLVSSITSMAGQNVYGPAPLPSPSTLNAGTNSAPVINVVNGDYTMPSSGSGILLVTGTLTMNGNPSFNGLILVIGKGNVQKNGGGNGTLDGSMLVANMFSDPGTWTHPISLGANNPPGTPTIAWNGGGNATVQYDSCWLNYMSQSLPFRTITDRELIY